MADQHSADLTPDQFTVRGTEGRYGETLFLFCPAEDCEWHGRTGELVRLRSLLAAATEHLAGPVVKTDGEAVQL